MAVIIIDDFSKRHQGESETTLPKESTIRIEIGNKAFRIKINHEQTGFDLFEVSGSHLVIEPKSSNLITIT